MLCGLRGLRGLRNFALVFLLAHAPLAWADCDYSGFTPHRTYENGFSTYYDSAGNFIWSISAASKVYIQPLATAKNGCPVYVLKKAGNKNKPENQYDVIFPVLLDATHASDWGYKRYDDDWEENVLELPAATHLGFVAFRAGVGVLLDSRGKRLIPEPFQSFENNGKLVKIEQQGNTSVLLFHKGRLRPPPQGYAWVSDEGTDPTGDYRVFVLEKDGQQFKTFLRPKDMREVIPPFIGNIVMQGFQGKRYFFAQEETGQALPTGVSTLNGGRALWRYQLYDAKGTPLHLPEFHDYQLLHLVDTVLLVTYNYRDMSCRLYEEKTDKSGELVPTIDLALPLQHGNCPYFGNGARLVVQYADTVLIFARTYFVNSAVLVGKLQGEFFGNVVDYSEDGDKVKQVTFVVKTARAGETKYRVYKENGELMHEQWFTDALDLGCGFLRVKDEGVWYSLRRDGSLTTEMYFPFSC